MKTHFNAPWGKPLSWISVLATLLLIGVSITPVFFIQTGLLSLPMLLGTATPLLILPGAALFVIRGYTLTGDSLIIHRLLWDTRILLATLTHAESIPDAMSKSLRTCGNGGLYSFTGWYWSKKLGHYRAFVTDLNRTVLLRFITRRIVVSPDDPEAFIAAMKPHLPVTPP